MARLILTQRRPSVGRKVAHPQIDNLYTSSVRTILRCKFVVPDAAAPKLSIVFPRTYPSRWRRATGDGADLIAQPDVGRIRVVSWMPCRRDGVAPRYKRQLESIELTGKLIREPRRQCCHTIRGPKQHGYKDEVVNRIDRVTAAADLFQLLV